MKKMKWIKIAALGVLLYQNILPLSTVTAEAAPVETPQALAGNLKDTGKSGRVTGNGWSYEATTGKLQLLEGLEVGTNTDAIYQAPWLTDGVTKKMIKKITFAGEVTTKKNISRLFDNYTDLEAIEFNDNFVVSQAENMSSMFEGCSSLTSLDLGDQFDTSAVTNMTSMFFNCSELTSLDLGSKFDTNAVTNMENMFYGCRGLTSLDLGTQFGTGAVTNMENMFNGCSELTSLDLGAQFDTVEVTDMSYMFYGCGSLTSLDLGSQFNTSAVTDMMDMFSGCGSLTSLDLGSQFNTSAVTDMMDMFYGCSNLIRLDLGTQFDTSAVEDMTDMFTDCSKLSRLRVGGGFKFGDGHGFAPTSSSWYVSYPGNTIDVVTYQDANHTVTNTYFTSYFVDFDAQGGTQSSVVQADLDGSSQVDLPTVDPVKAGYIFTGWYTQPTGGIKQEGPIENVSECSMEA